MYLVALANKAIKFSARLSSLVFLKRFSLLRFFLAILLSFQLFSYLEETAPFVRNPQVLASETILSNQPTQQIQATKIKQPFSLPHPGYLSTKFSSYHPGIDIAVGLGIPIHPISSGKVIEVALGVFGLGHFVSVEHEEGFKSIYGHMGRVFVKVGDEVSQASILGQVGLTGKTSGPHTHLEIMKDGDYINPEAILPELSSFPLTRLNSNQTKSSPAPQTGGRVDLKKELLFNL